VVDRSVTSGGSGGGVSEVNDLGTTLLDARGELILEPGGIDESWGILSANLAVSDIGVHGWRVVSPDGHLLDVGGTSTSLQGELGEGSVVIKTGHGSEVLGGKVGGIVLADESVGVSGVTDDDGLGITGAVVVDSLANIDEDSTVVLEEITSLHTLSTGLGTDEEVVVDILEGSGQVRGDDDFIEKGEGAIVELSLDTLEDLLLEGKIEEVKNDTLVLSQKLTRGDSEDDGVSDLAGGSRDKNTLGIVRSGRGSHRSLGDLVESVQLVEVS